MGLITPGPVVITATFIGYLAAGWQGAIVATIAIFTPIFLGVVLPGPWFIRHRDNAQIKAFVKGATAAAAGAIAGAVFVLSRQTIHDWATAGIAAVTLAVLLRSRSRSRTSSPPAPSPASACTGRSEPTNVSTYEQQ